MPFSHPSINSMSGLAANPLGTLQHQQQHNQHMSQSQYHQRADDMTPPLTYQCHMSRLNIPSPGAPPISSLHQTNHNSLQSLVALQNSHSYSSSSSSPHNTGLEVAHATPNSSASPIPSSLVPPSSMYSSAYDPMSLGYGPRHSPCHNESYQMNGSYGGGNGNSGMNQNFRK